MKHRIIRTGGQRIAWANTTGLPDDDVVEAIKFVAREADLDKVVTHFKHARPSGYRGWAYRSVPRIANLDGLKRWQWRNLITVHARKGEERLTFQHVSTLAHEAKHVEQYREHTRVSEVACNAFGHWVADRWFVSRQREVASA